MAMKGLIEGGYIYQLLRLHQRSISEGELSPPSNGTRSETDWSDCDYGERWAPLVRPSGPISDRCTIRALGREGVCMGGGGGGRSVDVFTVSESYTRHLGFRHHC